MKDRNELIYRIRQIIGDEEEDGFYTRVEYNGETIKVPNCLFKDGTAEYPEIRISPFLRDSQASHSIRIRDYGKETKTKFYNAMFQVDIYATNIVLANKIYSTVKHRIDFFYDIDTVLYGYDKSFQLIDSERNIWYTPKYNTKDFTIIGVMFFRMLFQRARNKQQLKRKDTYFIDETGLYIHTDLPIKMIRINSIINGLVFPDGDTAHQKGIIKTRTMNKRQLSKLEENDVERISFELGIFYRLDSTRNPGVLATDLIVDADSD